MKRSINAALLSGLAFPGVGQLYLGHRWRGMLFLLPALVSAVYFFNQAWERARSILTELEHGRMALDPLAIAARLEQQGQQASALVTVAATVMIVCWIASTIDAWLLGRQQP